MLGTVWVKEEPETKSTVFDSASTPPVGCQDDRDDELETDADSNLDDLLDAHDPEKVSSNSIVFAGEPDPDGSGRREERMAPRHGLRRGVQEQPESPGHHWRLKMRAGVCLLMF